MKRSVQLPQFRSNPTLSGADKILSILSFLNVFLALVLLLLLVNAASASGHPAASDLHLRLYDNAPFSVKVNNFAHSHVADRHVISNLKPGRHYLEVVRYHMSYGRFGQVYQRAEVVFSGHINIRPRTLSYAMIDHRGRFRFENQQPAHVTQVGRPGRPSYPPAAYQYVPIAISPQAFARLAGAISSNPFDSSRLRIAQQALDNNYVTSDQVYQLMSILTFESNRLKLARYAYKSTVDKQNYFIVNNALTFNSSVNQLSNYIAQNP